MFHYKPISKFHTPFPDCIKDLNQLIHYLIICYACKKCVHKLKQQITIFIFKRLVLLENVHVLNQDVFKRWMALRQKVPKRGYIYKIICDNVLACELCQLQGHYLIVQHVFIFIIEATKSGIIKTTRL